MRAQVLEFVTLTNQQLRQRTIEIEAITASLQCAQQSGLVSEFTLDRIVTRCGKLPLDLVKAIRSHVDQLANDPAHGLIPIWETDPPLVEELRIADTDDPKHIMGRRRTDDIHLLVYGSPQLQHALEIEADAIIEHGGLDGSRRECQVLRDVMGSTQL